MCQALGIQQVSKPTKIPAPGRPHSSGERESKREIRYVLNQGKVIRKNNKEEKADAKCVVSGLSI